MKKKMLSSSSVDIDTRNGTTCLQYNVAPEKKIGDVNNNFRGNDLVYASDPDRLLAIPVTVTIPKSNTPESELNSAHDDEKVESLESQVSKITL